MKWWAKHPKIFWWHDGHGWKMMMAVVDQNRCSLRSGAPDGQFIFEVADLFAGKRAVSKLPTRDGGFSSVAWDTNGQMWNVPNRRVFTFYIFPICSMYGISIFTYIWVILRVNVVKYSSTMEHISFYSFSACPQDIIDFFSPRSPLAPSLCSVTAVFLLQVGQLGIIIWINQKETRKNNCFHLFL